MGDLPSGGRKPCFGCCECAAGPCCGSRDAGPPDPGVSGTAGSAEKPGQKPPLGKEFPPDGSSANDRLWVGGSRAVVLNWR